MKDHEDDYEKAVSSELVGTEVVQGYKFMKVIGAGNVGTTILAKDLQRDGNVVLKIYHIKSS